MDGNVNTAGTIIKIVFLWWWGEGGEGRGEGVGILAIERPPL